MSAIPQTYKCDAEGCTRRYDKDANHWLAITGTQVFNCTRFNNVAEKLEGTKHACGFDHASQIFAKWLSESR